MVVAQGLGVAFDMMRHTIDDHGDVDADSTPAGVLT
jgi:hypothetical protein